MAFEGTLTAVLRSGREEEQSIPYRVRHLYEQEGAAHLGRCNVNPHVLNGDSYSRYEGFKFLMLDLVHDALQPCRRLPSWKWSLSILVGANLWSRVKSCWSWCVSPLYLIGGGVVLPPKRSWAASPQLQLYQCRAVPRVWALWGICWQSPDLRLQWAHWAFWPGGTLGWHLLLLQAELCASSCKAPTTFGQALPEGETLVSNP